MPSSFDPLNYQAASNLLENKIIAVTGAGSGIGKAAALSFAGHGATVILMGRTVKKLEAVYDEIMAAGGPEPAIYPIDFSGAEEEHYLEMAANIDKEFGQLHGILFNAAILGDRAPLAHYNSRMWQRVMQVNVTSQFLMCKALLPLLERAQSASVVFTGSSVGYQGRAFWGAYAISKAATENMMQIFADELADDSKLRFNSINPGATRTGMRADAYPGEDPNTLKRPEDIMAPYLYLMGDDSLGVNGEQLQAQPK